jgi:hypothetical protein
VVVNFHTQPHPLECKSFSLQQLQYVKREEATNASFCYLPLRSCFTDLFFFSIILARRLRTVHTPQYLVKTI